ncbi:hypothetical protein NE237_007280 [Protea cynaroides]|uniref:Uncharacterized protein n=1 Tax=Protea cynaroides TaxID=273540 RepID=A0A9Q0KPY0_9MAGN|nr:hypothetical protein NE237_007280 [Protea cynaroides]
MPYQSGVRRRSCPGLLRLRRGMWRKDFPPEGEWRRPSRKLARNDTVRRRRKTQKRVARQEFKDACLEKNLPVLDDEDYDPEEPNLDDPAYQDLEEEQTRQGIKANRQTLETDEDMRKQMFRGVGSSRHAAKLQGQS